MGSYHGVSAGPLPSRLCRASSMPSTGGCAAQRQSTHIPGTHNKKHDVKSLRLKQASHPGTDDVFIVGVSGLQGALSALAAISSF
eukprot:70245-Rhodomonas_salina.1